MATSGLAIVNLSSHGCEKRNDLTQTLASRNNMTSKRSEPGVSSHLTATMSICMLEPHVRNAIIIREVLEQDEVNYKALVEVYVGQKSSYILLIKHAYQTRFRRLLDQDILNIEPKHSYQKILVALSTTHKAHHVDVNRCIAKSDAKRLYETGEARSQAVDQAVILEIFSKRSIPQLKLTFSSYKQIYGHDYIKSLKKDNSTEFEDALKMVVQCMCNPAKYYAKTLYASIKETAKDKGALRRVLMSRAGADMDEISRFFKKKYGMELTEAIRESIPSGDYRDILIALAANS